MRKQIEVCAQYAGMRLDAFLSKKISALSRTKINNLIRQEKVWVGCGVHKPSYVLKENDIISMELDEKKDENRLEPFERAVPVIFEDDDILIIDKPGNIVVHPPAAGVSNTLVNALIFMKKELSSVNAQRPGVVHRLDKETSGVMVLAKNNPAHLNIVEQFKSRRVKKEYLALCWGVVKKDKLTVDLPLGRDWKNRLKMKVSFIKSRNAYTEIEVLQRFNDATLLKIKPLTGRMHQIRVHLKFLDVPIIGDKKYGIKDSYDELFLHALKIGFYHPVKGDFVEFSAALPQRFEDFIRRKKLCIQSDL